MSKKLKWLTLSVASFLIFPIGIILFFKIPSKREAQYFGVLGILGILLDGFIWGLIL